MGWVTVAQIGIAAVSAIVAGSAAEDAEDDAHAARQAAAAGQQGQNLLQGRMVAMAEEEWALYKEKAFPLLEELAAGRDVEDRTEEEMARAAGSTKEAYGTARQNLMRRLNLEEDAGSPRSAAILRPTYTDEATAVSRAVTDARLRVEDTEWGRTLQAVGAFQRLPQDASANLQGASTAAARGTAAGAVTNADLARMQYQNAGQAAYGAGYFGTQALNRWNRPPTAQPAAGGASSGGGGGFMDFDPSMFSYDLGPDSTGGAYRHGGAIKRGAPRIRSNYQDGGPIEGPGTGTSDSIRGQVEEGSYILSADTVRAVGEQKLHQLAEKAGVRPGSGGDDRNGLPVRLSRGEWQIPPQVVSFHGEEFFNKMQQKYHRPVEDEDGMANGGAMRKRGLPKLVQDALHNSMPGRALARRRG
jgi:hypothetical protein